MIELINIEKEYKQKKSSVKALDNVSLTVKQGEIFGIIGHSGAGKSTLLRCVNLLEVPTSGLVRVDNVELTTLRESELMQQRKQIGMIFQHFNLMSTLTVAENIAFPLTLLKMSKHNINARVDELLELVGLSGHRHHYPSQLSGGQKQRVGIARALATNPKVLLCDEATSALDPQTTESILSLLKDINQKLGITILLITHEMGVIRKICDRVAVMNGGQIVEIGQVIDVFLHPQHKVTQQFLRESEDTIEPEQNDLDYLGSKGKRIYIQYSGNVTYEPILYDAVKKTDVTFTILQGKISKMKHIPYGQLLIELQGETKEIEQVISDLLSKGLEVTEV